MTLYTSLLNVLFYNKILHYKNIIKVILNIIFVLLLSVLQILVSIASIFFPFIFNTGSIHPYVCYNFSLCHSTTLFISMSLISSLSEFYVLFDMKYLRHKQMSSGKKSRTVHCSHKVRVLVTSWYPLGTKLMKGSTEFRRTF